MPRRIADYPDEYASLNFVASVGSLVSVMAIIWFIFVVVTLKKKNKYLICFKNLNIIKIIIKLFSKWVCRN